MFDGRIVTERGRFESVNFTWKIARTIRAPSDGWPFRERNASKMSSAPVDLDLVGRPTQEEMSLAEPESFYAGHIRAC